MISLIRLTIAAAMLLPVAQISDITPLRVPPPEPGISSQPRNQSPRSAEQSHKKIQTVQKTVSHPRSLPGESAASDLSVPPMPHFPLEDSLKQLDSIGDPDLAGKIDRHHQEREQNYKQLADNLQKLIQSSQQTQRPSEVGPPPVQPPSSNTQTPPPADNITPDDTNSSKGDLPPDNNPQPPMDDSSTAPGNPAQSVDQTSQQQTAEDRLNEAMKLLPAPEQKPESVFADSLSAQALIDGPVDRVGLADNLYALGELNIALEMYQQVDVKELPRSERYWISYQSASCLRRLGQTSEAQTLYRRLAGQAEAGWLAKMSRWWLDQIDARKMLTDEIEKQKQIVDALSEVLNDDME